MDTCILGLPDHSAICFVCSVVCSVDRRAVCFVCSVVCRMIRCFRKEVLWWQDAMMLLLTNDEEHVCIRAGFKNFFASSFSTTFAEFRCDAIQCFRKAVLLQTFHDEAPFRPPTTCAKLRRCRLMHSCVSVCARACACVWAHVIVCTRQCAHARTSVFRVQVLCACV